MMYLVKLKHMLCKVYLGIALSSIAFGSNDSPEVEKDHNRYLGYQVNVADYYRVFHKPSDRCFFRKMKFRQNPIEVQLQEELDALLVKIEHNEKASK